MTATIRRQIVLDTETAAILADADNASATVREALTLLRDVEAHGLRLELDAKIAHARWQAQVAAALEEVARG